MRACAQIIGSIRDRGVRPSDDRTASPVAPKSSSNVVRLRPHALWSDRVDWPSGRMRCAPGSRLLVAGATLRPAALLCVVFASAVTVVGCSSDRAGGAGTSDSGAPDATTGEASVPECVTASDCAGGDGDCTTVSCTVGRCATTFASSGTRSKADVAGDCRKIVCDGKGGRSVEHDDGDAFDDGNDCTEDACAAGSPTNLPLAEGTTCTANGGKLCDGRAACVECLSGSDCPSGVCDQKHCIEPRCFDGVANALETDVDCGGPDCIPCGSGKQCTVGSDCLEGYCAAVPGVCERPTCTDGVKNSDETDVDCGGSCTTRCGPKQACWVDADCVGGRCVGSACAENCSDQVRNGAETDVDCGGATCAPCASGKACSAGTDCATGVCSASPLSCQPAGCSDGVKNGGESDVDCGGSCARCGPGKACTIDVDCIGGSCVAGACAPSCTDGVQNGTESDVDCGGSCATRCAEAANCGKCSDCVGGLACTGGVCAPPSCSQGTADCDSNYCTNGCETNTDTSTAHCGSCNNACSGTCSGGVCTVTWSRQGGTSLQADGRSVAADASGSVTVAGRFYWDADFGKGTVYSAGDFDAVVARYDAAGSPVWIVPFGGGYYDSADAVAVDSSGSVAVAGIDGGGFTLGGFPLYASRTIQSYIARFDSTGNVVWVKSLSGVDAKSVAIDSAGDVIVVGGTDNECAPWAPCNDVFVAKLASSDGTVTWQKTFGDTNLQWATGVGTDASNNILLSGVFTGDIDFGKGPLSNVSVDIFDLFVAKLDPNGNALRSQSFAGNDQDMVSGTSVASDGKVALIGTTCCGGLDFGDGALPWSTLGTDLFIAVLDPSGGPVWSKEFGVAWEPSSGTSYIEGDGISFGPSGGVAVAGGLVGAIDFGGGELSSAGSALDAFVATFGPTGSALGSALFGDSYDQGAFGVSVGPSSRSVYVTGSFMNTIDFGAAGSLSSTQSDLFLARLAPVSGL